MRDDRLMNIINYKHPPTNFAQHCNTSTTCIVNEMIVTLCATHTYVYKNENIKAHCLAHTYRYIINF